MKLNEINSYITTYSAEVVNGPILVHSLKKIDYMLNSEPKQIFIIQILAPVLQRILIMLELLCYYMFHKFWYRVKMLNLPTHVKFFT